MSLQRRLQPNAERAILLRSWLAALKEKEDEEEEEEEDWPEGRCLSSLSILLVRM